MSVTVTGLDAFMRELSVIIQKEISAIASTYKDEVRSRTPVDTGRARRGWANRTSGKNREVRNQVPYISKLESGYSRQAPNGFVNQAVNSTLSKRKTQ
tara:strand:- start:1739 stop:2032 length:294 start_codon:yes stop_codon:yes gene_type:complete